LTNNFIYDNIVSDKKGFFLLKKIVLYREEKTMSNEERTEREFHVGDVLSITTGRLVSPRHMDGIYDILDFMTGDSLFTHQLPRVSDECKPYLLEQFPELKGVDASGVNTKNWKEWLDEQVAKYGEKLVVKLIPKTAHTVKNPVEEMFEMKEKVSGIVINK